MASTKSNARETFRKRDQIVLNLINLHDTFECIAGRMSGNGTHVVFKLGDTEYKGFVNKAFLTKGTRALCSISKIKEDFYIFDLDSVMYA